MRFGYVLVVLLFSLLSTAELALAQRVSRVSVSSGGVQGNRLSFMSAISGDGRFVTFMSDASNLVPDDTNGCRDVFVHDLQTRETLRVSASASGAQGDSDAYYPSISTDGRYVSYDDSSMNFIPGDGNGHATDVVLCDLQTRTLSLMGVNSAGEQADSGSANSSVSGDGRYVTFVSAATNLPSSGTTRNVYVHDRDTGITTCVTLDRYGRPANKTCSNASISADGSCVVFDSIATNLVVGDYNGYPDVFVRDTQTGQVSRANVSTSGDVAVRAWSGTPSISVDGQYVAFRSGASNLVLDDTNGDDDIFVHDRYSGETSRVNVDSAGTQANSNCGSPSISADGRYVAFSTTATNLVGDDTNGRGDCFVHDRATGETFLVSLDSEGNQGNGDSNRPVISADAHYVTFTSAASNLVPDDTNGVQDVFVIELPFACDAGNVNGGRGFVADVLFVNDSTGGMDRTVRLLSFEPLSIFVSTPPSATGRSPFVLYAWPTVPDPNAARITLPFGLGVTCLPTPLTGGTPQPLVIWNNTSSSSAGAPTRPSSPAPSSVLRLPRGLRHPARAFVQGFIRDAGAPNERAAVTNGVSILID